MHRLQRLPVVWLALPAFLLFYFLALDSMVGDSPTMDEQNHLARGLAFVHSGDPRFSLEHPPLINTISSLPLLTLPDLRLPFDHPSWNQREGWYQFADLLLWEYNQDVDRMIFMARLPIVWLTLAMGITGYHFARRLWKSRNAGLLTLGALLFDPNILAHGRYTTTDAGGALFASLAAFSLWIMWRTRAQGWAKVMPVAVALGLAFGSKFSTLLLVPIFILLAFLPLYGSRESYFRASVRRLGYLGAAGIGAIIVVWLTYGLQWGPLAFQGGILSALNGIRAPMPTFWAGIEQILFLSQGARTSFLLGETKTGGFAAYFPIAFAVKTPLPTLLLYVGSLVLLLRTRYLERVLFLLVPVGLYVLITTRSDLNIGYRHLLPVLPFLAVLVGGLATAVKRRSLQLIVGLLFLSLMLVTIRIHPHYLSFFNLLGGGPENGHRILIDSNIDWGQDLLRLKQWLDEQQVDEINLAWFGTARPEYYGVNYIPLPGLPYHFDLWWAPPFDPSQPAPGTYVISASALWEPPLQDKYVFSWFRAREPDERIGYSVFIYEVP